MQFHRSSKRSSEGSSKRGINANGWGRMRIFRDLLEHKGSEARIWVKEETPGLRAQDRIPDSLCLPCRFPAPAARKRKIIQSFFYFIFPKRSRGKESTCLPLERGEKGKKRRKECLKVQGTFFLKLSGNYFLHPKSLPGFSSIFVHISGQDIPQQGKLSHFLPKPGRPF